MSGDDVSNPDKGSKKKDDQLSDKGTQTRDSGSNDNKKNDG